MMPPFDNSCMLDKYGHEDTYVSPSAPVGAFPGQFPAIYFYARIFTGPVPWLCRRAARGMCDDTAWVYSSVWLADILEASGCRIIIEGLDNVRSQAGPCVYIANHMSTLETFLLPGIIRPHHPVTFVVKKSLTTMPFFGPVMRSRDPVAVGRVNPREDLALVLEEGTKRLKKGISIIVFPQSTRSPVFSRAHFNSIGVKLARKAEVPVIPLALKTDAWAQGKLIKDFGAIKPAIPVHFKFGEPLAVNGNGKKEHETICRFIEQALDSWQQQDAQREKS